MTDYGLTGPGQFNHITNSTVTDTTPEELHDWVKDEDYQDPSWWQKFTGNEQNYRDNDILISTVESVLEDESLKPQFLNGEPVTFNPSNTHGNRSRNPLTVVENYCNGAYGLGVEPEDWRVDSFERGAPEYEGEDERGYVAVSADVPVFKKMGLDGDTLTIDPVVTGEIRIEGELSGEGRRSDLDNFEKSISESE